MSKCPICEKSLDGIVCRHCGYDASLDFEKYPTVMKIPVGIQSNSAAKRAKADTAVKAAELSQQKDRTRQAAVEQYSHWSKLQNQPSSPKPSAAPVEDWKRSEAAYRAWVNSQKGTSSAKQSVEPTEDWKRSEAAHRVWANAQKGGSSPKPSAAPVEDWKRSEAAYRAWVNSQKGASSAKQSAAPVEDWKRSEAAYRAWVNTQKGVPEPKHVHTPGRIPDWLCTMLIVLILLAGMVALWCIVLSLQSGVADESAVPAGLKKVLLAVIVAVMAFAVSKFPK